MSADERGAANAGGGAGGNTGGSEDAGAAGNVAANAGTSTVANMGINAETSVGRQFHSVALDSEKCKGCINCIKRCPTQAIRVRNGKAHILSERCIDCGECIRVCQNRAKLPLYDPLSVINEYSYSVALPAPALYGQFNRLDSLDILLGSLLSLGFDDVFEVARAAEIVSDRTRALLCEGGGLQSPVISSACPAVVRLIKVRFPGLVKHLLPLNAPIEFAARLALKKAMADRPGLRREDIGIIFISPCAAKVTAVKNPIGAEKSEVDAVLAIKDVYPQLLAKMNSYVRGGVMGISDAPGGAAAQDAPAEALAQDARQRAAKQDAPKIHDAPDAQDAMAANVEQDAQLAAGAGRIGVSWCGSGGESSALLRENYLAADGIENVINVLEDLEDDKLGDLEFIELNACSAGCVGGVLTVENAYVAATRIKKLRRYMPVSLNHYTSGDAKLIEWDAPVEPDSVMQLSDDYATALDKIKLMKRLIDDLPGLDCGSCGAPTCEALAEDVVKGVANETDCIFKLRDHVHTLIGEMAKLEGYIPPPFRTRRTGPGPAGGT